MVGGLGCAVVVASGSAGGRSGVVPIHGFRSKPETWKQLRERIEQDRSLDFVRVLPEIDTVVDSLKEYLRTEGEPFENLVLVTHSMGGPVAQRYLARMLDEGHGREPDRIRRVVMLACPNDGSELARSLRREIFGRVGRNPQERQLRPLNHQVAKTRRTIVNQVLRASEVIERTCPIPFSVYAGESDGVVPVASAKSFFPDAAALPGDHFGILKAARPENRTFVTLRRLLQETAPASATSPPTDTGPTTSPPTSSPDPPPPVVLPRALELRRPKRRTRDRLDHFLDPDHPPAASAPDTSVVTGMPGVGKTALVQRAGNHAAGQGRFPGGVVWRQRRVPHPAPTARCGSRSRPCEASGARARATTSGDRWRSGQALSPRPRRRHGRSRRRPGSSR
ncbi:esterase/lipase family protein [Embleya sp. AB8]|uniref:esterase/lipase family protein n=1 Tax=Embleya sp. AB8 TaxID=3156304 RepID=UPI003C7462A8